MKYHWIAPSGDTNTHEVGTRRPASADRTARRQFQATGQPVSRTQASHAMTTWLPCYEAKCVQSRCFQCGSVPLRSDIKLPPANILQAVSDSSSQISYRPITLNHSTAVAYTQSIAVVTTAPVYLFIARQSCNASKFNRL